jgi:hypothetical protein
MNENTAPAGEMPPSLIEELGEMHLAAGSHGNVFGVAAFARAIIEADRALREPGQISSAAVSNKTFFDWWPFAFDPECDGMALEAWNAATAAKDADYALGVNMLRTEITALKTQLTHAHQEIQAYDLTMDRQAREIAGLAAERDAQNPIGYINRGTAYHTKGKLAFHEKPTKNLEDRWWSADEPVYAHTLVTTLTAERDALKVDAERYRRIRNGPGSDMYGDVYAMSFQGDGDIPVDGEELDRFVDAAITKEPK